MLRQKKDLKGSKLFSFKVENYKLKIRQESFMLKFFQIIFFTAAVISIVLNSMEFNKWQHARKEGSVNPYPLKWFNFILNSVVSVGCALSILFTWIG